MHAFRHILVAVDGSASSLRACDEAAELAVAVGAEIVLLHVLEPSPFPFGDLRSIVRSRAERELERQAVLLRPYAKAVSAMVVEGAVWVEIGRVASELPADVVVIGTQGRRGFSRALLESVAERIVRTSPVPVLTVPAHAFASRTEAAQRLAAAIDTPDLCLAGAVALSRGALPIANVLARACSGTLDLWLTVPLMSDQQVVGAMGEDEQVVVEPGRALGPAERTAAEERARTVLRAELWELRGSRSMGPTDERPILLVADGLDSAAPVIAAAKALRPIGAMRIVLATPIASRAALAVAAPYVDRIVCLEKTVAGGPEGWYRDDSVPSERRARDLLDSIRLDVHADTPLA
jgi:nucleotide-binding universal stress UspA family protein/predicted phosphoribosyltransferase